MSIISSDDNSSPSDLHEIDFNDKGTMHLLVWGQSLILTTLIRQGKIDRSRCADPEYIGEVIYQNSHLVTEAKVLWPLEGDFLAAAREAVAQNRRDVAVVLTITAVDQIANQIIHLILEATERLSEPEITEALRAGLAMKHRWFLRLVTGHDISDGLWEQIKEATEVRNSLVHYKPVPELLDEAGNRLKQRLARADIDGILELPKRLERELTAILFQIDPVYSEALNLLKLYWTSHKAPGTT